MENFLVVGLGNPGLEYSFTRHNIGFLVIDELASRRQSVFRMDRHGLVAEIKVRGKHVLLLKPNTFMNLSGKAVRYWIQQEKIAPGNWCIITDDLALPFGHLRLRPSGSDGGHNGLKSIQDVMQTQQYLRLRWGIGNEFAKGKQSDFVLGKWSLEEESRLPEFISRAADCIEHYISAGPQQAMNLYNTKPT